MIMKAIGGIVAMVPWLAIFIVVRRRIRNKRSQRIQSL